MSYMYVHFDCCDSNGCGDATMSKQDQILANQALLLAALADVQTTVDDIDVNVDQIETVILNPIIC